jgi:hypothetical protein
MNKSKWLVDQIITLDYRGYNYREISDKLQVSLGKISKIMHKLNVEARDDFNMWLDYRTPREYQKSLYLITYLQKKTIELLESAKTESAQLEAINRLVDIDREKRQLLSDGLLAISPRFETLISQISVANDIENTLQKNGSGMSMDSLDALRLALSLYELT